MRAKTWSLVGASLLVLILLVSGCGSSASDAETSSGPSSTQAASASSAPSSTTAAAGGAEKVIKIGAIETLTGPASDVLKIVGDGDMLAQDYINNVLGGVKVNGETYKVQVILRDNKMTTEGAVAAAQELISNEKCSFMVGSMPPFITAAISSVTEPNRVLYIAPLHTGTNAELNASTSYKFISAPDNRANQVDTLKYIKDTYPNVKRIAYILVDDGCIPDNEPVVKAAAQEMGLEILGDVIGWTLDTVDFAPVVQKALNLKPDAIMTGNGGTGATGAVLKLAREQGFSGPIVANNFNPPQDVLQIAGPSAATDWSGYGLTEAVPDLPPLTKQLAEVAVQKYGRLDYIHIMGFNAVYCLVQAIEKAQSLDPTAVRDALASMDEIDTGTGMGKMGGSEAYGVKHIIYSPVQRILLQDGKIEFGPWTTPYIP